MSMTASLLASMAVVGGPLAFLGGFRSWRIQRLIQDTPTARIRSMAMGRVELNGHVECRSRQAGPFSGHECAYWEIDIATQSGRRHGTDRWSVVHTACSGSPFYLRDDTGVALVYPQGAQVRTSWGVQEVTGGFGVPSPYSDYMEAKGLGMRHLWAMGPMRFRERLLETGTTIYVLGRAHPKAMSHALSDENELEESLAATGTDAWSARRLSTVDHEVTGVVRKGEHDPAYLISPTSERLMSVEYGLKAWCGLLGGPAVTLFGLWCVLELMKSGGYFR